MLRDKRVLEVQDFGAGSRTGATKRRGVSQIAHSALKPQKFGQLLFRLANYYQCKTIVELGTSLGITTCYLASACNNAKVYTLEGASAVAAVASQNISWLGLKNVEQVTGNFDDTLPPLLNRLGMVDLVYIDGNHRKEPTLRYFDMLRQHAHHQTMLVFDDIHWSREMEDAWEQIRQHESVTLSVDLFFLGIVFFNPAFREKQHFRIRY
jgi:predicted O-methyltransferase YrrM